MLQVPAERIRHHYSLARKHSQMRPPQAVQIHLH